MKRLLSVLLAITMIFSCFSIVSGALYKETSTETKFVYAQIDTTTEYEYEKKTYADVVDSNLSGAEFIAALSEIETNTYSSTAKDQFGKDQETQVTVKKQFEILGIPVNYIYNNTGTFFWKNLTGYPAEGQDDVAKSDLSLIVGNINMYLLKVMKSLYSDFRFYTDANAVKCINLIGNLFYPDYVDLAENTVVFEHRDYIYSETVGSVQVNYADEDIFFEKVAELSGLTSLIETNWVKYGDARANYRPLLLLLGVTEETLLESEYYRGDKIAPAILESAFTKIMGEGPIAYFLNIFKALAQTYRVHYFEPIRLLFTQKADYIDEDELKTLTGLLNLIFNDNNPNDVNKFQFAPLPETRLAIAEDDSEFNLVLLMYLNLNAHFKGNANCISNLKSTISTLASRNDSVGSVYRKNQATLVKMIDGIFGESIEDFLLDDDFSNDLTIDNLEGKPNQIAGNLTEAIARMIKKIADWFQRWIDIFRGDLEFGAGAFE